MGYPAIAAIPQGLPFLARSTDRGVYSLSFLGVNSRAPPKWKAAI